MSNQTKAKQAKIARLLEFCRGGKTSEEIIREMHIPESTLGNLRKALLDDGRLYKEIPAVEHFYGSGPAPCYFVTTGTTCDRAPPVIKPKDAPDPKLNHDFIKVAHNCLHIDDEIAQERLAANMDAALRNLKPAPAGSEYDDHPDDRS